MGTRPVLAPRQHCRRAGGDHAVVWIGGAARRGDCRPRSRNRVCLRGVVEVQIPLRRFMGRRWRALHPVVWSALLVGLFATSMTTSDPEGLSYGGRLALLGKQIERHICHRSLYIFDVIRNRKGHRLDHQVQGVGER